MTQPNCCTAYFQGGIAIGDLNGDGKPDIVAAGDATGQIDVLLGNGAGGFQEVGSPPTSMETGAVGVSLTDINGAGYLDLVIAHCCGVSDGTYLLGQGNGAFQAEQQFTSGSSPAGIAAAKFSAANGLVSADETGSLVAVTFVKPNAAAMTITSNVSAANTALATIAPNSFASEI